MAAKILTELKNLLWFICGYVVSYLIFFCSNYIFHAFGWDLITPSIITIFIPGIVILFISARLWGKSKNFVYGLLLNTIISIFGFIMLQRWL